MTGLNKFEEMNHGLAINRVDIVLPLFSFGGGETSVEGLWMGVPVITKRGDHFFSHLSESIAHNTGLSTGYRLTRTTMLRRR